MDIMDVANFFIDTANAGDPDEDDAITNMKLNKLLFFAQAASMQRFGKPLFDAPIEAWKHGPVVDQVYHTFKSYGRNGIDKTYGDFDWRTLDPEVLNLLCDVYRQYAVDYSASGLRRMTHEDDTPWSKVYEPGHNNLITVESIGEWVKEHPLPTDKPVQYRTPPRMADVDAHGYSLWPDDWDDE